MYSKKVTGTVVKGLLMGRKIGFPTINIAYDFLDMPFGIYCSKVYTPFGSYKGALHFGPKKFFGLEDTSLEVYLLDFSGDLYGETVIVEIYDKIRNVMNFDDMESLKKQIRFDVEIVRHAEIPF